MKSMNLKEKLKRLNTIGDSSHLVFSKWQKICRWVAYAQFIIYYFAIRIYATDVMPTLWITTLGITAIVLYVRMMTFKASLFIAYLFFICIATLNIMLFYGQFDTKIFEEITQEVAKQGLTLESIQLSATLGGSVLIILSIAGIATLFIKRLENKLPSIFWGFLIIAPIVVIQFQIL